MNCSYINKSFINSQQEAEGVLRLYLLQLFKRESAVNTDLIKAIL